MPKSVENVALGIFILILALFMWRITHSFEGWAILFACGTVFVLMGLYKMIKDRFNE